MTKKQKLNQELLNQFVDDFITDNEYCRTDSRCQKYSGEIVHFAGYMCCVHDLIDYAGMYNQTIENDKQVIKNIEDMGDY